MAKAILETDLYPPVKRFLEAQGYEVKSEIYGCDIVGIKKNTPLTIIELKTRFNLEVVLQGVDRLSLSNNVYLAILEGPSSGLKKRSKKVVKLCQLLGFGILLVTIPTHGMGYVTPVLDPAPYQSRQNPRKSNKLLKEFFERHGDPNTGGSNRQPIITAYRQNALRILDSLKTGHKTIAELKQQTGVSKTAAVLQRNFYGWFKRVERGIYELSPEGITSVKKYAHTISALTNPYKKND